MLKEMNVTFKDGSKDSGRLLMTEWPLPLLGARFV